MILKSVQNFLSVLAKQKSNSITMMLLLLIIKKINAQSLKPFSFQLLTFCFVKGLSQLDERLL